MPNFRHRLVKMNMKLDIYTPDVGNTGGKKLIYKTRGNGRMERPRNIWAGPNWPTHMFKKIDSDTTCRHKELFFCSHFVVAPQLVLLTRLPDFGELVWFQVVLPQAPHQTGVQVLLIAAHLKTLELASFSSLSLAFLGEHEEFGEVSG